MIIHMILVYYYYSHSECPSVKCSAILQISGPCLTDPFVNQIELGWRVLHEVYSIRDEFHRLVEYEIRLGDSDYFF